MTYINRDPEDRPSDRELALDHLEPVEPLTEGELFDALQRSAAAQREHDKFMAEINKQRNEEWWSA